MFAGFVARMEDTRLPKCVMFRELVGGNDNHNADLSIEVDRTQRMVQLPEVHPRTVRPTERSTRAQNPDAKSRGTQDNAVRLRHVEPERVPLRHAAPNPPQVLDSLYRLTKA